MDIEKIIKKVSDYCDYKFGNTTMKKYTMLQVARMRGVCKSAVFRKIKKLKLGKLEGKLLLLTESEVKSLVFRAKNKKPYKRRKQNLSISYI